MQLYILICTDLIIIVERQTVEPRTQPPGTGSAPLVEQLLAARCTASEIRNPSFELLVISLT